MFLFKKCTEQIALPCHFNSLLTITVRISSDFQEIEHAIFFVQVEPPMLPPMIVYTWPPFPPLRVSIWHLTGLYCNKLNL